jgi:hypothetical protein
MMIKRWVMAVLTGFALSACSAFQQKVDTHTTVFYTPEFKVEGTIAVLASDEKLANSLEFSHYRSKFEAKLKIAGYVIAPEPAQAKYIALVAYGIDNGDTSVLSTPIFGFTGGGYYVGNQYIMPSYGVVDVMNQSVTTFTRAIAMDIILAESLKTPKIIKLYESRTKSVGGCSVMVEVFDEMLEAMFNGFPALNATHRKDSIPANINC